jgi:NitT/TauT family transport system substrate-binding protein/putative hydroxymethylpyrimidine transport system substrate-binding protein
MNTVVASLAAVIAALALGACGGGGAEPGASDEATLVLDFQPNAVHAGIYAALADRAYDDRGIELTVREPSASADAPKLLQSGRAEFAILDIHDLAIARERGLDLVGVGAIVQRPLAAVIARDRDAVRSPRDLAGGTVGVTGLPSDEAILDSVLASAALDAGAVNRVTIGFDSVAALAAGRLDAATAFWNAEGVAMRRLGIPTREFRVDELGAPRYPELVLATAAETLATRPSLVEGVIRATARGYADVVADPAGGLDALLAAVPDLDRAEQRVQLEALLAVRALRPGIGLDRAELVAWADWEAERGIVARPPSLGQAFRLAE